jgi:hypothetical protein
MAKKPPETPVNQAEKPNDKDQLLNDAAELIRSLKRQAQEAMDAATTGWLNRFYETRKGG